MKKRIIAIFLVAAVLCLALTVSASAETKTAILKIGDPYMTINGKRVEIDPGRATKPVIINGRTLIPIRAIVEQMGGSIAWDGRLRQVMIFANNKGIRMRLDLKNAGVISTGQREWTIKPLDVPPKSINGRTMVPLRFVSEQLGAKVGWDGKTKRVTITFNAVAFDSRKWTGAWSTNQGNIVFVQSGTKVETAFDSLSLGKITGTVSGNTFTGKYYIDPVDNGSITLTMSADGKSFKGSFTYRDASDPKHPYIKKWDMTGQR